MSVGIGASSLGTRERAQGRESDRVSMGRPKASQQPSKQVCWCWEGLVARWGGGVSTKEKGAGRGGVLTKEEGQVGAY